MPLDRSIKKVLVIGSGPIVIGQAAEFDYAGTQACRVLKQEGINVVLINPNPATIMTDRSVADEIYLEPLTVETVKRVIEKEKPDSFLAGLGGQTGLTLASELYKEGYLQSRGVRLIGTNAEAIDRAEDRKLFKETMNAIGEPTVPSEIAESVPEAVKAAEEIGYPVIVRPAFTLGGAGGGVAYQEEELRRIAENGLDLSPISQILVEKYIGGWKEIEFETMRDGNGNVIAVCSMENFDPVGIHTGDSIVTAPALTLADREYQMLRTAALNIISALEIVGGCNCQFALDPDSFAYSVIEVNPRVSRSSALASKATGYPIAKVTAKIALGYTLDEITNDITGKTCACFEPTLDYVVVKFPKWPFDKFYGINRTLGTQMKATGEVMAIGTCFEAALMKAVRGAEISLDTLNAPGDPEVPVRDRLHRQDDRRLFTVFEALKQGVPAEEIHRITKIDRWFLSRLEYLAKFEARIRGGMSDSDYAEGKRLGYPDAALKRLSGRETLPESHAIYKMVDTCGAEFDAQTPYFYAARGTFCDARRFPRSGKPVIAVLGSGPIRIGQGIEFDYSSVHCVHALKKAGYDVVIINNNPETVSTDYDTADRLYFEPLTPEDVTDILEVEHPIGVVVAFGGQTAIKLTKYLDEHGVRILGTSAEGIDLAEDRERFDALLEQFGIRRPRGFAVTTLEEALNAAEALGYPVLLRPSYVIGGQNMKIVREADEVREYMSRILKQGIENPVLIDQYLPGSELEVDVISDGKQVLIPGVMEHIERAGVHSGDSIAVYPPYSINDKMLATVAECSEKLALALKTKGLVNIQYLIYGNELYVIEVNPRASRTVPYISKVTGVEMVDIATRVMLGETLEEIGCGTGLHPIPAYTAVKVPVFSFRKLADANAYLSPEMKSTGEVLGIGKTLNEALFKGLAAADMTVRTAPGKKTGAFISVDNHDLGEVLSIAKKMEDLNLSIFATKDTARAIEALGIPVTQVANPGANEEVFRLMEEGRISVAVYTGAMRDETVREYIALHRKAMSCSIPCLSSLDTANTLIDIIGGRHTLSNTELVDINHLRKERRTISFLKMQGTGDDYIFLPDFENRVEAPESLCVPLCDRHYGIGGDGIVTISPSETADAKMRIFNRDGTEGAMAGNCIRCVAKYLYDSGRVRREEIRIETGSGIRTVKVYTRNEEVTWAEVNMGQISFRTEDLPCTLDGTEIINRPVEIGGQEYRITALSIGNPHCVVFEDQIDALNLEELGPLFEHAPIFPERINTEFVRWVNANTLKMRVYERGSGETYACGTGACAAAAAAIVNGLCPRGEEITVKLRGGDLTVLWAEDGTVTLSGDAKLVCSGTFRI